MILFRLLSFLALSLFFPFALKREFKIPPAHEKIPYHKKWETEQPSSEILKVLSEPFTYLTHGNQTTVFLSQDGQYVLKLFRYNRTRFPFIHKIKTAKKNKKDLYTKLDKTFTAAALAATIAKPFTQVVFCHLNLTKNSLPTAQLIKGKSYTRYVLPLDRQRFVLQRRAKPFKEALLEAKSDRKKMERLIDSFITLLQKRSALGIRNSDPNLSPNFGFIGEEAVEIDFGNYRMDGRGKELEIEGFISRLNDWLQKNELSRYDRLNDAKSFQGP